ncbi:hypothetical protein WN943_020270 [Citrus x changshan-huyou]
MGHETQKVRTEKREQGGGGSETVRPRVTVGTERGCWLLLSSSATKLRKETLELEMARPAFLVASSSSSTSGNEEPFISLGDENEDDCVGIFSPAKHLK